MASTTKRMTSACSMASSTCLLISPSKMSSLFTTQPPVSTIENSRPCQSTLPYWRSRVVPAVSSTIAVRLLVRRLKSVDLPTLGRPTMATNCPMSVMFFAKVQKIMVTGRHVAPPGGVRLTRCSRTGAVCSRGYASRARLLRRARGRRSCQRTARCRGAPLCRLF